MSFGDFPVFTLIYAKTQVEMCLHHSLWLHRLFKASNPSLACHLFPRSPQGRETSVATFLSVFLLSSASGDINPSRWGCQVPPDPTPSVSTLPAGRPSGHLCRLPETFDSGTLLSFSLQGFDPPRDPRLLPDSVLPCRFRSRYPARDLRRSAPKVCSPWESELLRQVSPPAEQLHTLLVFSPLRLSSATE